MHLDRCTFSDKWPSIPHFHSPTAMVSIHTNQLKGLLQPVMYSLKCYCISKCLFVGLCPFNKPRIICVQSLDVLECEIAMLTLKIRERVLTRQRYQEHQNESGTCHLSSLDHCDTGATTSLITATLMHVKTPVNVN